jgi:hypothetical protein
MRAHTIAIMSRRRRRARRRAIALVLAVCSLAIPASAGAYSSVNAITGGSEQSSQPSGGSDHSTPTAINGRHDLIPGYASPNAITGAEPLTVASGSPSSADQGFDWPSALVGAGSAMALVALGGAALLTVRRQRPLPASPASAAEGHRPSEVQA